MDFLLNIWEHVRPHMALIGLAATLPLQRLGFEVDDTDRIHAAIGRGGSSQVGCERNLSIGTYGNVDGP